jgi:hypothetical protein
MEKSKKRTVGAVKVPMLSSGVLKIINKDLSVNNVDYYLLEQIIVLSKTINLFGLKNGYYISKHIPI